MNIKVMFGLGVGTIIIVISFSLFCHFGLGLGSSMEENLDNVLTKDHSDEETLED